MNENRLDGSPFEAKHNRPNWLRGKDSNLRPSGYEPDELPLLHPASQTKIIPGFCGPVQSTGEPTSARGWRFAKVGCSGQCGTRTARYREVMQP